MLSIALEKEAAIARIEEEERMARRNEVRELQGYYQDVKSGKEQYEKMIDGLVAVESDKMWNKQEMQWRREDLARVNLLKNVYQNREADIELKRKLADQANWLTNNEKQNLDAEVDRQNQAFSDKQMADALSRKNHQTDILR
jgi:hypothetical protein